MSEQLILKRFKQKNGSVSLINKARDIGVFALDTGAAIKNLHEKGFHDFKIIESDQPWPKRVNA